MLRKTDALRAASAAQFRPILHKGPALGLRAIHTSWVGEPFRAEDFEAAIDDVFEQLVKEFGGLVELDREEGWQLYPEAPRAAGVSCLRWGSSIAYQIMTDHGDGGVWELDAAYPDSLEFIRDATRAVSSGGVDEWVRLGKSLVVVTMPDGDQEACSTLGLGSLLPDAWWRRLARHTRYRPWS